MGGQGCTGSEDKNGPSDASGRSPDTEQTQGAGEKPRTGGHDREGMRGEHQAQIPGE
jgi:hypothetical protein